MNVKDTAAKPGDVSRMVQPMVRCHFCKSECVELIECNDRHWVECQSCLGSGAMCDDRDGAIENWNNLETLKKVRAYIGITPMALLTRSNLLKFVDSLTAPNENGEPRRL